MKYQFSEIDHRKNRTLYMYTKFEGKAFLKSYLKSRKKIENIAKDNNKLFFKKKNLFFIEKLEYQFKKNFKKFKGSIKNLIKSFEIHKKFFISYDNKWKRDSKKEIDLNTYILLSFYFSKYLEKSSCLKTLNCLLKVNDYILFQLKKKYISKNLFKYIEFSFSKEIYFVKKLYGKKI